MRVSEQWLREWVNPAVSSAELAEQLTMAGLEVDSVDSLGSDFSGIVVGRVTAVRAHPDAGQLRIATVDVGQESLLQIVCGAPNLTESMCVPTALVGAELAGRTVEVSDLRGVASRGMLCSAKELGLGEEAGGLMVLPPDSQPGQKLQELLQLDDHVFTVELTPNRGDCLSIAGIAREVGVINRCGVNPVAIEPVAATIDERFGVTLASPRDCARYVGRVIRNVDTSALSPLWMVERLRRAGIRSLGPLVDVTNYVLLELGQPLHAFDLNKLSGQIVVRRAQPGERLTLLNEQQVELSQDTLVISDDSGAIALAGIMGGADTECDDNTRDVFLEGAYFNPVTIAGRARRYGLHTDASHRFERGVAPQLPAEAIERATRLLIEIAGGEPGPLTDTRFDQQLPVKQPINLRAQRIERLLGMTIEPGTVRDILTRLGMRVDSVDEHDGRETVWSVTPPGFRFDITMEADLIEELGRIYGYEHLPVTSSLSRLRLAQVPEGVVSLQQLRATLVQRGYQEAITYSFIDPELQRQIDPGSAAMVLANPIAADMAVMRTSLWPGLLTTLAYNLKRQRDHVRLFESGLVFAAAEPPVQQQALAGLAAGPLVPEQWASPSREVDFFDLKNDVEALLLMTGGPEEAVFIAAEHPALHPGQSARIERGGRTLGWLGGLHPRLAQSLELDTPVFVFELMVEPLREVRVPHYRELSKYPSSRRDIALVVAESVPARAMYDSIRQLGGDLLRRVWLFDVYRGKGIPEGKKSLTFGLILQDFSSNLTDEAVDQVIAGIVAGLNRQHGAAMRT